MRTYGDLQLLLKLLFFKTGYPPATGQRLVFSGGSIAITARSFAGSHTSTHNAIWYPKYIAPGDTHQPMERAGKNINQSPANTRNSLIGC
ncbi:hypothetical protein AB833_14660 [Chromatiales bacterium (ex Bugula neritina AB1)]|nr:hypothetical protein AB833_14660 [Chromatiales bacterium (ex Bugula neritina AB1)]